MTVTDTARSEEVRSSAYVVELRAAAPLLRALENALACASTEALATTASVQFHFDGGGIEVQATDRYVALYEQVAADLQGAPVPFRFLLPRAAAPQATSFLKSVPKTDPVTITWWPVSDAAWSSGTVRLSSYDSSTAIAVSDAQPPSLRRLLPGADLLGEVAEVAYGRAQVVALSKIKSAEKKPVVRISFTKRNGNTRADWLDERRTLLMMSRNLDRLDGEWGVPGL